MKSVFFKLGVALQLALPAGAAPHTQHLPAQTNERGLHNNGDELRLNTREGDSVVHSLKKREFALEQIENKNYTGPDAQIALMRAYGRYAQTLPPRFKKAIGLNPALKEKFKFFLKGGQQGIAVSYPSPGYDSEYVVPVSIGTPAQNTFLNLDTGSADLWTFSTDTYPPHANGHPLYRPKNSTTSDRLDGQSWSIRYGDGAYASGIVYKDRVQVGPTSFDKQAVQSAVQVSMDIAADKFSAGILGMAWGTANTVRPERQVTYIENIKDSLAMPLFVANLQKGRPGRYDFGFIERSQYNQDIAYRKIDDRSPFWKVTIDGYQVGSDGKYNSRSFNTIVDTGTTLLLVPQDMVDSYYDKVDGAKFDDHQGMVVFPCSSKLPVFQFGIGSYRGTVPGHYINYSPLNSTHCYGGLQTDKDIGFSIVGDVLIKAQYIVFDLGQRRLGFANKNTSPPPS